MRAPELSIGRHPFRGPPEGLGGQTTEMDAPVPRARKEPGALEHPQVLGHAREGHRKRSGELGHRGIAATEPRQDRSPRRVGKRREGRIQDRGGTVNHSVN